MTEYQVVARKFRPQTFGDVVSQEAIVTTLKNAIKHKRLAQAYLFCGSRGTGKTTLARLFAKALNCHQLSTEGEPCNECSSCREITAGSSLDVLEIDGASHRGIDDIRQINDNVGYAAASGGYKVYLIDEVHMLTKEAFNALLKTLEEPPPKVKFFFATTEPQKVPPTILSRCQRFNLTRIPLEKIVQKLQFVAKSLGAEVDDEALHLIAHRAEGGLRDAESLFDQILAFQEGAITASSVRSILGLMPRDVYFELDKAGKEGNFSKGFELSHQVFAEGKDLVYFVEELTEHIRAILLIKCDSRAPSYSTLSKGDKARYKETAELYSQEQCLNLLEYLVEAQQTIRFAPSGRIALEAILLHVMRSHFRLPIETIVRKLGELEKTGQQHISASVVMQQPKPVQKVEAPKPVTPIKQEVKPSFDDGSLSEDPTPSPADLGIKVKKAASAVPAAVADQPQPVSQPAPSGPPKEIPKEKQSRYDTLLQFAAIELEGRIQRQ